MISSGKSPCNSVTTRRADSADNTPLLNDYIVLIVVGVCLCVGYIMKNVITTDKINRFIPLIVGCLGVIINVWVNDWSFSPEILLGGLFSGLTSTGLYELFKNLVNKDGNKNA